MKKICYLKRFYNKRKHRDIAAHVLIIRTRPQNDDIVKIVPKLKNYGFRVTLMFTNKYLFDNIEESQGKTEKATYDLQLNGLEYFEDVKDALADFFKNKQLRSALVVIENKQLMKELKKYKGLCRVFSEYTIFRTLRRERSECLRKIKSATHFTPVKVNPHEYPHKIAKVADFVPQVPRFFLFFTAFGYFRNSYNFRLILKAYYTFLERQDKFFGNEVLLAIGGNFNGSNYADDEYFTHFQNTVYSGKYSDRVILLKNITREQKKSILRLSYAMMYFNVSEHSNEDVRLALSVGTPLIGVDNGFVRSVINKEPLSGYLAPLYVSNIVGCMYALTSPVHYEKTSSYARLNYLKFHTKFGSELEAIRIQGMKKKLLEPPKKLLKKRSSTLQMLK